MDENTINLNKKIVDNVEEEEENLIEEERLLNEEFNSIQEKHKDVRLVYEKITENIKNITKTELKKYDDNSGFINNSNNSDFLNNSELDKSDNYIKSNMYEDELIRLYKEYLESIRNNYKNNFMNKNKSDLIEMLKERRGTAESNNSRKLTKVEKNRKVNRKSSQIEKTIPKNASKDHTQASTIIAGYNEYVYSDEENNEDDKRMKEEYDQIVNNFKKKVCLMNNNLFILNRKNRE